MILYGNKEMGYTRIKRNKFLECFTFNIFVDAGTIEKVENLIVNNKKAMIIKNKDNIKDLLFFYNDFTEIFEFQKIVEYTEFF